MDWRARAVVGLLGWLALAPSAGAEECPPPPPDPAWKGAIGAGVSTSSGNTSAQSYNLSLNAVYDPKRKDVFKADALYLRQENEDVVTTNKTSAGAREQHQLGTRAFVFGELRYLRDPNKGVRYVVSPVAGFGYKLVDGKKVVLSLDGGAGGRFEGLTDQDGTTSGAVQASEAFAWKISPSATFAHKTSALWNMSDFGDGLYRMENALSVSVARRFELKLADYLDYKTRPPSPDLKKQDNSLVVALVFKIG